MKVSALRSGSGREQIGTGSAPADDLLLQDEVERRIKGLFVISERLWPEKCDRLEMPVVKYTLRGKIAGKAWPNRWEIAINPGMAAMNSGRFVDETVAHEIAHLIAHRLSPGGRPHGVVWKTVMLAFGQAPKRLHAFNVSGIGIVRMPQVRYAYSCECRRHYITKTRHNRIMRGAEYRCLCCKGVIRPVKPL